MLAGPNSAPPAYTARTDRFGPGASAKEACPERRVRTCNSWRPSVIDSTAPPTLAPFDVTR